MKQRKRTAKAVLQIGENEVLSAREGMSYWLGRISPDDTARLWKRLRACAKDASDPISLVRWANGTISTEDSQIDVTASTIPNGFVLIFTDGNM
jgi:hypothetical protein